jgi:hypothetical protein
MNRRQMFGFIALTVGAAAAPVLAMAAPRLPKRLIELDPSAPVGTHFTTMKVAPDHWLISGTHGYQVV